MSFLATLFATLFATSLSRADAVEYFPRNTTTTLLGLRFGDCGRTGQDIDLPGSDIGSVREAKFHSCWNRCQATPYCEAWTWTNFEGGTCYLKSGYGTAVYRAGALSGISYASPGGNLCPPKFLVIPNCDMPGNDVANGAVRGANYFACMDFAGPKGQFFTWSDYNGGTCWLKFKVAPCQFVANKYTGIFMF